MSRIGIRLLINQHLSLFSNPNEQLDNRVTVGYFDKKMNVKHVVEQAYEDAVFLCERNYFDYDSPELNLTVHNGTNLPEEQALEICYIASHLHHICFEVFKNSQRATIERAIKNNSDDVNEIKMDICIGNTEIAIKIEDLGGGASNVKARSWFDYLYTTAPKPQNWVRVFENFEAKSRGEIACPALD